MGRKWNVIALVKSYDPPWFLRTHDRDSKKRSNGIIKCTPLRTSIRPIFPIWNQKWISPQCTDFFISWIPLSRGKFSSSKLVVNHWRLPRVELRSRRRSKIRPNRLPGPSISTSREENAIPGKMFDVFTGNGNPRFGAVSTFEFLHLSNIDR